MAAMSDFLENNVVDGLLRTGATLWTTGTAYVAGQMVWGDTASAVGKLMECTVAGTSHATTEPTWPAVGSTVADNTATWKAWQVGIPKRQVFVALLTAAPSDTGGGTEVTGTGYARVQIANTNAAWAATNAAADTRAVSTGASGTTSNNGAAIFGAPTASWGVVTHFALYDALTTGNLLFWAVLTQAKTINNGDAAPSFAISALTVQLDN